MEPRIQYARTSDGVSIAYIAEGSGPTLVQTTRMPFSTLIELEVDPNAKAALEARARLVRVVEYDCRGVGFSDRGVTDFSVDALVQDLEAVVSRVTDGPIWLFAGYTLTPVAIAFAARHPEAVAKMVLWCGFSSGAEISIGEWDGAIELAQRDWETACESISLATLGFSDLERGRLGAEVMRRSISSETYVSFSRQMQGWDVGDLLSKVKPPTLIMHGREFRYMKLEASRKIAALIPNSELRVFEGSTVEWQGEGTRAVVEFLVGSTMPAGRASPFLGGIEHVPAFRAVLFTDIVGHTGMMSRLGDKRGREVLREHERITREVLKAHGGTEVKTMGDGFMASFGSVTKAVECAIALQRAMETLTPDPSPAAAGEGQHVEPLQVRCGLNAGEPIEEDGDLFGATVILAARIAAKAEGGEILVADTVRGLCSGKGFLFSDRGEFVAKGFEEPVRVYEVSWRE